MALVKLKTLRGISRPLSAILQIPIDEFESIEYTNTELYRYFKEDKKGILDKNKNSN